MIILPKDDNLHESGFLLPIDLGKHKERGHTPHLARHLSGISPVFASCLCIAPVFALHLSLQWYCLLHVFCVLHLVFALHPVFELHPVFASMVYDALHVVFARTLFFVCFMGSVFLFCILHQMHGNGLQAAIYTHFNRC